MKLFEGIKIFFLKKKNQNPKRRNANADRKITLKKTDQFLHVLILANDENEVFFKSAENTFANAEVFPLFLRKKKEDTTGQFRFSAHESDFNLTGSLKNDKLTKLSLTKFDLVVDLSSDSELLRYFLRTVQSDLIIGQMGSTNGNIHDLFLESGSNEEAFLANISKQLNHLNNGHK